jgi:hypothetical protein
MSRDGIPQVVNYHVGVGVAGGVIDRVYGGISGEGEFKLFCIRWLVLLLPLTGSVYAVAEKHDIN